MYPAMGSVPAAHVLPMPAVPATKRMMPAIHVLPCLRCLRRRGGCLQTTFYRARGACIEDEDSRNPRLPMPAVVSPRPRRLQRNGGCLQPAFHRACGACDEEEGCLQPTFAEAAVPVTKKKHACKPCFTVLAVPATKKRMPVTCVLPLLRCLRSKLRGNQM